MSNKIASDLLKTVGDDSKKFDISFLDISNRENFMSCSLSQKASEVINDNENIELDYNHPVWSLKRIKTTSGEIIKKIFPNVYTNQEVKNFANVQNYITTNR